MPALVTYSARYLLIKAREQSAPFILYERGGGGGLSEWFIMSNNILRVCD